MPSNILKAAKSQQEGTKFWRPGSALEEKSSIPNPATQSSTKESISSKSPSKPLLSKGVMSMKFMARKLETQEQEKIEARKRRKILDSGWSSVELQSAEAICTSDDNIVCTTETEDIYSSLPGRRSFGGFNKIVERHYQQTMDSKKFGLEGEKDVSISDEEMLNRYTSLIGVPNMKKKA